MLHDSETWGPNAFELEWIRSNDRVICWISGIKDRDKIPSPDGKVHGANMEPIWGRQDPGEPYVGPKNLAIQGSASLLSIKDITAGSPSQYAAQIVGTCTACHALYHRRTDPMYQKAMKA